MKRQVGPTLGLEYKLPKAINSRICPYFYASYGAYDGYYLEAFDNSKLIKISKNTIGFALGTGIKFEIFKGNKFYSTFGFMSKFENAAKREAIDSFNAQYQTNFDYFFRHFMPSISLVRVMISK